jgi:hypothetical protein
VSDGSVYKTQIFSAPECRELGKPSPSGSGTPMRRKAATETSPEELEEELEERLDLEALDERLEDLDFGACRARKRRRTSSFRSTSSSASVMGNDETKMWASLSSAVAAN